jgi:hypothetical protein
MSEKKNVRDNRIKISKKRYNGLNALLVIVLIMQFISFVLIIGIAGKSSIQINYVISTSFNETLSTIEKNCGSVYITHMYGSNGWFVFKPMCVENGYCKYGYVPLEECLKP